MRRTTDAWQHPPQLRPNNLPRSSDRTRFRGHPARRPYRRPFPAPSSEDPLPIADVLVVTYTVAEGYALADILTPGIDTRAWTEYKNGWDALEKLIIGHHAPALGYGRTGLW